MSALRPRSLPSENFLLNKLFPIRLKRAGDLLSKPSIRLRCQMDAVLRHEGRLASVSRPRSAGRRRRTRAASARIRSLTARRVASVFSPMPVKSSHCKWSRRRHRAGRAAAGRATARPLARDAVQLEQRRKYGVGVALPRSFEPPRMTTELYEDSPSSRASLAMLWTLSVTTPDHGLSTDSRSKFGIRVRGAVGAVKPAVSESPNVRMRGATPVTTAHSILGLSAARSRARGRVAAIVGDAALLARATRPPRRHAPAARRSLRRAYGSCRAPSRPPRPPPPRPSSRRPPMRRCCQRSRWSSRRRRGASSRRRCR